MMWDCILCFYMRWWKVMNVCFLFCFYFSNFTIDTRFIHIFFSSAKRNNAKSKKKRQSLYSIEFSPPADTILDFEQDLESNRISTTELSPKPMTPRRVKRRSVMARGTNNRQSTASRRSHTNNRSSVRSSRRKIQQNPVTKMISYQQGMQQNSSDGNQMIQYITQSIRPSFSDQMESLSFIPQAPIHRIIIKCINWVVHQNRIHHYSIWTIQI